jgi:hypothetical protein
VSDRTDLIDSAAELVQDFDYNDITTSDHTLCFDDIAAANSLPWPAT